MIQKETISGYDEYSEEMPHGLKDRLFGLHMTLEVSTILRSVVASTRMVTLESGVGGNELYHPVIPNVSSTSFDVECQLPHSLNREDQYVILHIAECDHLQRILFQTEFSYHWIKRQKMLLKQKMPTDSLSATCCFDDRILCRLKLIRVGALVACRLHSHSPSFNISSYNRLLEKEIIQLRTWASLHIPPNMDLPVTLYGVLECPFYTMMTMADHIDQDWFGSEGASSFPTILPWSSDVANTWRMTKSSMTHDSFWTLVDYLCCNVTSKHHTEWMANRLSYPQTNKTTRNICDVIGCRMVIVDLLYQVMYDHRLLKEEEMNMLKLVGLSEWLQFITDAYWPFIGIVKKSKDNSSFSIICGLGKKDAFRDLVQLQRHDFEADDFISVSLQNDTKQQLCLVVWRDYKEDIICMSLLQTCSDIDHLSYDVTQDIGVSIHKHGIKNTTSINQCTVFSKTLVRTVCQAREICHKSRIVNTAPTLRPWLNSTQALVEYQQGKCCFDWHKGWVTYIKSQWQQQHVESVFDHVRQVKIK